MTKRKRKVRKTIDSRNRDIIGALYKGRRSLTGNQLAKIIDISPPAIKPRLDLLQKQGYVKTDSKGKTRKYTRKVKGKTQTISSPSRIFWTLNITPTKKKKKK